MKGELLRRCRDGFELLLDCYEGSALDTLHQKCYWVMLDPWLCSKMLYFFSKFLDRPVMLGTQYYVIHLALYMMF
jgi:hypothetical protein